MVLKTSDGWELQMSEPLSAMAPEEEPDLLLEYLNEIRYPYRKKKGRFIFPTAVQASEIFEALQHFYEGVADVIVEGWQPPYGLRTCEPKNMLTTRPFRIEDEFSGH